MFLYVCNRFLSGIHLSLAFKVRYVLLSISLFIVVGLKGQNSKTYIKAAEQFIENGYYEDAIEQYTQAIIVDPENGKAYEARAQIHQYLKNYNAAIDDFQKAAIFNENPAENYFTAANLAYQLHQLPATLDLLSKAIAEKQKFLEAYILQCNVLFEIGNFKQALQAAENAIDVKNTAYTQYLKGYAEYKLGDFSEAEQDLEKAIIKDKMLFDAFLTLAELQIEINKTHYAIENCSYVLLNDRDYIQAYVIRSKAYNATQEYAKAIQDISQALSADSANVQYLILRGNYYMNFAQYQNAINDYTFALNEDIANYSALSKRAQAYEKLGKNKEAVSDYSLLLTLTDDADTEKHKRFEQKIYELNRETHKPNILLEQPVVNDDLEVLVANDLKTIELQIKIEDDSDIRFFKINNDTLLNRKEGTSKKVFNTIIKASDLEFLTLSATDVYDNTSTVSYAIERIETNRPVVNLMNPYVGDDDIITLSSDDNFLYIEGRIEDENRISSIQVDEVTASYVPQDLNPRFTATIDIRKKNRIQVTATDIYGNTIEKEYLFRRDGRILSDESPMGKTWVVLIENSEYKDFPNLSSPAKDILKMQQALSRYKINKVIVKSNLTKREMERFFSIELRDLVRVNQVNSLFIWFAGHGEQLNGTGYWIPSDARKNVEFSYFNINALKASLYSYSSLTHLLVVSDACETGPAFCEVLRGPIESVSCSQTQLSQKRSAQVFTSAGSGYAYDNSLFTRSFANALLNNDDDCVSIEDIARRVSIVLESSNRKQNPEFGRISGIEDELGTFFFITR
jgi:tetratricopeptide (TPR) repeat protein